MRIATLSLLLMCQAKLTAGSRILLGRMSNVQSHSSLGVIHEGCGKTALEKEIGSHVQHAATRTAEAIASKKEEDLASLRNPFAVCRPLHPEVELQSIVESTHEICALGKLAKSGNFFASADGTILVKRIETAEAQVLSDFGDESFRWDSPSSGKAVYSGACPSFAKTLFTPMLTTFLYGSLPYVVMPNLTHYFSQAAPSNWAVQVAYDVKPLPNLGEGVVKLVKGLRHGWGKGLQKMIEWEAWNEVRHQLEKDVAFLEDRVVDFSLFVHVIEAVNVAEDVPAELSPADVPAELSPGKGCIVDPSRTKIVCFRILDYLTPRSWKRDLESQYKASKFDHYAKKFMIAFDCFGDIERSDCGSYKALASISEAMEVSKAMAKGVLIGTKAFAAAYTCKDQTPFLQYREVSTSSFPMKKTTFGDELHIIPHENNKAVILSNKHYDSVGAEVAFHHSNEISEPVKWLQSIASIETGTEYVRKFCTCENCTDFECAKYVLEYASPLTDERLGDAEYSSLHRCAQMVNSFSTESYRNSGDEKKEMHNVLWAPERNRMIAVRGLPQVPLVNYSHYVHRTVLERGRLENCFLKMHYLRCEPKDSQGVYFNYQQHFGTLEVMVLYGSEYSTDLSVYADLRREGVEVIPKKV